MKVIPLTQGLSTKVDDEDFERLSAHKWYAQKATYMNRTVWYASRSVRLPNRKQCKTVRMHREILGLVGLQPQVDHRNSDTLDNQKENLRCATPTQNGQNKLKIPSSSRFKGVTWFKKRSKWRAQIQINGRKQHLGLFETEQAAADVYNHAAQQSFGDFARVNSPEASSGQA